MANAAFANKMLALIKTVFIVPIKDFIFYSPSCCGVKLYVVELVLLQLNPGVRPWLSWYELDDETTCPPDSVLDSKISGITLLLVEVELESTTIPPAQALIKMVKIMSSPAKYGLKLSGVFAV